MAKQKKVKAIATTIYFNSRGEMKRALARSRIKHGNYGFSAYVRDLITADLPKA